MSSAERNFSALFSTRSVLCRSFQVMLDYSINSALQDRPVNRSDFKDFDQLAFMRKARKALRELRSQGNDLGSSQLVSFYDAYKYRYGTKYDYHRRYIANWRTRLTLESMTNTCCSFLTLTYDDEHLPRPMKPSKDDVQKFMKRLRRTVEYHSGLTGKFKYFLVSEYGDRLGRLHYHAIFFGLEANKNNEQLLASCWQNGFVTMKPLSIKHVRYCTKYMFKRFFYPEDFLGLKSHGIGKSWVQSQSLPALMRRKNPLLTHDGFGRDLFLDRTMKKWLFPDEFIQELNSKYQEDQVNRARDGDICLMCFPHGDAILFRELPIEVANRAFRDKYNEQNLQLTRNNLNGRIC